MHTINDGNASHFKELVMFPDYMSSGLWCFCGLGTGDPQEEIPISNNLVKLIEFWNDHWDLASTTASKENWSPDRINAYEKEIINIGRILSERVSNAVPCKLLENRCKLNIVKHSW